MKITTKMLMAKISAQEPCEEYTEEKIRGLLGDGKTLKEILDMKNVPEKDRIWAVTQFLDDKTNRRIDIWCARQFKTQVKEITDFIDVIEKYYNWKATIDKMKKVESMAEREVILRLTGRLTGWLTK